MRCGYCGASAYDGRQLEPENDKEYADLEKELGDNANWFICEACYRKRVLRVRLVRYQDGRLMDVQS